MKKEKKMERKLGKNLLGELRVKSLEHFIDP